jgi:hypothetical protein
MLMRASDASRLGECLQQGGHTSIVVSVLPSLSQMLKPLLYEPVRKCLEAEMNKGDAVVSLAITIQPTD